MSKKVISIVLAIFMVVMAMPMCVSAAETKAAAKEIKVIVNEEELVMDQAPIIVNGRTLVPMRAIFEALGVKVEWKKATRTVVGDWGYDSMSLKIGEKKIHMGDGRTIAIDVPARIIGDRTLVPVRAIAESLGAEVNWDAAERIVYVDKTWDTYYVSNVPQFIDAIGSNVHIQMAPGTYDLTPWINEQVAKGTWKCNHPDYSDVYENASRPAVTIVSEFDGYELHINDVQNFAILPAVGGSLVQILVEPRYATTLTFDYCSIVEMDGVTMGHTKEKGSCAGDVLGMNNSYLCSFSNMDLFGCGAYALDLHNTNMIAFDNCIMHDCTYGIMELADEGLIAFENCTFRDCKEYTMIECYGEAESNVVFNECSFSNLQGNFIGMNSPNTVLYFTGCQFDSVLKAEVEYLSQYSCIVVE